MGGEMPRPADAPIAVLQAPLAATFPCPHARGLRRSGGGGELGRSRSLLRLGVAGTPVAPPLPARCHTDVAWVVRAAFLAAAVDLVVVFVVVVVAAGAVAVARNQAVAGSPRNSASSRQRVPIMPPRDAIWGCSDAIIACSAVGGGGAGWAGSPHPFHPLERERLRAAPSSMAAGGVPARKGANAAPMAVRTAGRCRRAASWVATPSWSPIVLKARGRRKRETKKRQNGRQQSCSSARQPHHVQVHNKRREKHTKRV